MNFGFIENVNDFFKKYSNKLSMKALAGRMYVLVDSIFRIETVLEWVFQQVIPRSSFVFLQLTCRLNRKRLNESKRNLKGSKEY